MYIKAIEVRNYKSFLEPQQITFDKGINVIVGKNNVGKTALLEALSMNCNSVPHKGINRNIDKDSFFRYRLSFNSDKFPSHKIISILYEDLEELHQECSTLKNKLSLLPNKVNLQNESDQLRLDTAIKEYQSQLKIAEDNYNNEVDELTKYLTDTLFNSLEFDLEASSYNTLSLAHQKEHFHSNPQEGHNEKDRIFIHLNRSNDNIITYNKSTKLPIKHNSFKDIDFTKSIYFFKSERNIKSIHTFGANQTLENDLSNLAEVLNQLQGTNPHKFKLINERFNAIFPRIHHISIVTEENGFKIVTWTHPLEDNRPDLVVPLSESGTGLSHVLAMLYIVISSDESKVIIIDEPHSFLHPGAVRTLLEIFQIYDHHQYIISTHSPAVIAAARPSTINLLKIEDNQTVVQAIDINKTEELRGSLVEIGARLSDVFGMDSIIWVEGPTEEAVFKEIVLKLLKRPMLGTAILPVIHTGDFEGKNKKTKKLIMNIYKKLSGSGSLMPPALGFVFDNEGRSSQDLADMAKLGPLLFTKKRLFENYILHVDAIYKHISLHDGFEGLTVSKQNILDWMKTNQDKRIYWEDCAKKDEFKGKENWKDMIHAAKFLTDLYSELSQNKMTYQKTRDSVELAKIIIKDYPSEFDEFKQLLKGLLDNKK